MFDTNIINQYSNPFDLYFREFNPRLLKELFKWCEYLYYQSPHTSATIKKFAEYPITDIKINNENESLKKAYLNILNKKIKIKQQLISASIDFQIYGNAFRSMYFPFVRFLICPKCKVRKNIKDINYEYESKKAKFKYTCHACKKSVVGEVKDVKNTDSKKVNIIKWDPKYMDVNHNPYSGESEYYYDFPNEQYQKVHSGNKFFLNSTSMEVLEAIGKGEMLKFSEGKICHIKADAPSGVNNAWGLPTLVSTLPSYFHTSLLKKGNEAIALERILSFRVLFPQFTNSTPGSPMEVISANKWLPQLIDNYKKWRKDPNHIMFSPFGVGVSHIGGDAKALFVSNEIQMEEENIMVGQGVPKEFLYGGLSLLNSGSITLRILENMLLTLVGQLVDYAQWITDNVADEENLEVVEVELEKFKLVDDVEQKKINLDLHGIGLLPDSELLESQGFDPKIMQEKRKQDEIDNARLQNEIQEAINKLQNAASKVTMMQNPQGYNPQMVLGQAQQLAMQFASLDESMRKSQLIALQKEDAVMYAVVIQALEQLNTDNANVVKQQVQQPA